MILMSRSISGAAYCYLNSEIPGTQYAIRARFSAGQFLNYQLTPPPENFISAIAEIPGTQYGNSGGHNTQSKFRGHNTQLADGWPSASNDMAPQLAPGGPGETLRKPRMGPQSRIVSLEPPGTLSALRSGRTRCLQQGQMQLASGPRTKDELHSSGTDTRGGRGSVPSTFTRPLRDRKPLRPSWSRLSEDCQRLDPL
jgi:hypothetical protein